MFEIHKPNLERFLDPRESCGKKILSKCGLRFLLEWLGVASEHAKDFGQIHIFGTFYI